MRVTADPVKPMYRTGVTPPRLFSLLRGTPGLRCEKPKTRNSHLLDRTSVSILLCSNVGVVCTGLKGTACGTGHVPPSSQTAGNPAAVVAVPGAWTGSSWRSALNAPRWQGHCSEARRPPVGSSSAVAPMMVGSDVGR